jgi:hypothetical protein
MGETVLEFIIRTAKEGKAPEELAKELELLNTNMKTVGNTTDEVNAKQKKHASAMDEVKKSYHEFQAKIQTVNMALGWIDKAIDATAGKFVQYALDVDRGAKQTGMAVEEYSRFVQVADDVGVSQQSINTALDAATRKGIPTNLVALGKLSDQYLALQPGIERSKLLMDSFGRSGTDLQRVMEMGSAKMRENTAAVEDGLVMTEQAIQDAKDYALSMDNLNDRVTIISYSIGKVLVKALTDAADAGIRLLDWNKDLIKVLGEHSKEVRTNADGYEGYKTELERAAKAAGYLVDEQGDLVQFLGQGNYKLIESNYLLSAFDFEVKKAQDSQVKLNSELKKGNDSFGTLNKELPPIDIAFQGVTKSAAQLSDEMLNDKWWQGELTGRLNDLNEVINGKLGPTFDEYTKKQKTLKEEIGYLETVISTYNNLSFLTPEQPADLDLLKTKLEEDKKALKELDKAFEESAKRMMFNMLTQAAAADGLTSNEVTNLTKIAQAWGLVDTKTAEVTKAISDNIGALDTENIDGLLTTLNDIMDLPNDKDINVKVTTDISPEDLAILTDLMNPDISHKTIQVNVNTKETKTITTTTKPPPRKGGGGGEIENATINEMINNAYESDAVINEMIDNTVEGPGIITTTPFTPPKTGYFGTGKWGTPGWRPEDEPARELTKDEIYAMQLKAMSSGLMTSETFKPLEGYYYGTGSNEDYMAWYQSQEQKRQEDATYQRWLQERNKTTGEWLESEAKKANVYIKIDVQKLTDAEINRILKLIKDAVK